MQPPLKRLVPAWAQPGGQVRLMLGRMLACWDICLFAGIVAATLGLLVVMLLPRPEYELSLERLPEVDSPLAAAPASALDAEPPAPVRSRHKKTRKAPAKPPVLNLNTATAAQLDLLPGIGPALARRIVDYRKRAGGFATVEQVMEVSGIGPRKFEKMRPYLKL